MAKKVTISIPDMLHEQLEKWRESFNLSKMFQEVVTEAIHKKEEFQKRIREDLDLGQVVERLRREKQESEGGCFDSGRSDGIRWAKTAHYDDIQYALQWTALEEATADRHLGGYFTATRADNRLFAGETPHGGEYFLNYVKGWKNGVEQFWEEVRDKL
jgi:hypothetical protein